MAVLPSLPLRSASLHSDSTSEKIKDIGVKQPARVRKLGKDEELETALYLWFKQK